MTLLAFHGDIAVQQKYLARVRAHRAADEIVQGIGYEPATRARPGRMCAVGCTLDAYEHARYETELGVPLMLAHLEDRIFEGLSHSRALDWPLRFLSAIPIGADLTLVGPRVLLRILVRRREALAHLTLREELRSQVSDAICGVERVLEQWIATGKIDESAARSAAESARSAAWSARSAAESARSAAWSAACSAEYEWIADVIVEELADAPVRRAVTV